MAAQDAPRRINVAEAAHFSPDARVNEEIMATPGLVTRMNCYEPGQVTPMHMHPEEDEILYIVEGAGVVGFAERADLPIRAGDLLCLPSDQYHRITAGPDSRMVLIYFMKPGHKSTRPAGGEFAGGTDGDPAIERLPGERH